MGFRVLGFRVRGEIVCHGVGGGWGGRGRERMAHNNMCISLMWLCPFRSSWRSCDGSCMCMVHIFPRYGDVGRSRKFTQLDDWAESAKDTMELCGHGQQAKMLLALIQPAARYCKAILQCVNVYNTFLRLLWLPTCWEGPRERLCPKFLVWLRDRGLQVSVSSCNKCVGR